jgi:hypothetical protein
MIQEIRTTVMQILNKENFGYITPDEFNNYSRLAQIDKVTELQNDLATAFQKLANGQNGSDYADVIKNIEESLELFAEDVAVTGTANVFDLPVNIYLLNKVYYGTKIVDKETHGKIRLLLNSDRTAPTVTFPMYTQKSLKITVYPTTITTNVTINYLRYPKAPKWTYVVLPGSEAPAFNPGDPTYQDFELPEKFKMDLIVRILQYCGITIRENEVVQASKQEELQMKQEGYV